jgi:large subunit ribosomal protein L15
MIRLHNMRTRPGSKHRVKRLGCGESSGHGKTSGKGHKGQKARSGGSIRLGFEGGQMPLIRRLPKRGFNNAAFHKNYGIVNLTDLASFKEGTVVNEQMLREAKLLRGNGAGIKILGDGELKHALTIEADKISASAREKIEKAGGSVTLRQKPVQGPRDAEQAKPRAETAEAKTADGAKAKRSKKPAAKKKAPPKSASKKKPRKS